MKKPLDENLIKKYAQLLYRDIQVYVNDHMDEFEAWQNSQNIQTAKKSKKLKKEAI